MAKIHVTLDEVVGFFEELEDPRSTINLKHPLVSVVVIAMMAILAGAGGPTAIAQWAAFKEEFLLKLLKLPHGIPRKDVFRLVLATLKPGAFQACFAAWLTSLRAKAAQALDIDQPIFAVDGKSARRSHNRQKGLGALHSVSVWASEFGLSLGQVACAEKSNEITAIPELLQLVDIQGSIITIDAMGTQKAIAAATLVCNRFMSDSPPSARLPTLRNARRFMRSSRSKMASMELPPEKCVQLAAAHVYITSA